MSQTVFGSRVGIDHRLDERVAGQSVAAVQTRAGTFADGIEAVDARPPVEIHLDSAAHIVGRRAHGDIFLGDVDADAEALVIDVGKVSLGLFRVFVGHVEAHMVDSVHLHLLVDGPCHDVARGQREPLVIFLHERLARGQSQNAAIATHGFGDEEGRMGFALMEESRGVELHKLHVGHGALGPVDHRLAVACGHDRIGGGLVDGTASARTHHRHLAQIRVHLLRVGIEHIGPVALDVTGAAGHFLPQVVLRDDFHGEVVFLDVYIGIGAHGSHQSALNFGPGVVGMVQNAELGMSALAVKVEPSVLLLVEVHPPLHEFFDLFRRFPHHLLHGLPVAHEVAGNHGVLDVLVEVVHFHVCHRCYATLGKRRVGLFKPRFADHADSSLVRSGYFQGVAHAGHSRADNQKVVFVNHNF